jgi:pantoate--beta-alanine ligase
MKIITSILEITRERRLIQHEKSVGLVPTMGYLHEGHISLVKQARAENDLLTVSIFVNPTQFGPQEDLERYPRDLQRDLKQLEEAGVDLVFTPEAQEIYPIDFATYVDITGALATEVEGEHRQGHFRGVATIVLKLFQIMQPDRAYFGQKDAQQVAVITRMVHDFHLPVELRIHPTMREANGLAMSSRNSYLNTAEKEAASVLYQALQIGKQTFDQYVGKEPNIVTKAIAETIAKERRAKTIYNELRDPVNFQPLKSLHGPALLLIAVQVGPARLIDNFLLRADGTWETGTISLGTATKV